MRLSFPKEFSRNPEYRTPSVAAQVPLATVHDETYVLADGSFAAVYRIKGMEYDLAGAHDLSAFTAKIQAILNTCPVGLQFKLLHRIHHNYTDVLKQHQAEVTGQNVFARYLAWDQFRRFHRAMTRGELLRSENLIVLTYNPKIRWWEAENKLQALGDVVASLGEPSGILQRSMAQFERARLKFEDAIRPVANQLHLAGFTPTRLERQALYDLAWKVLNPDLALREECPPIRVPSARDPYAGIFTASEGRKLAAKRPDMTVVAPISEREQLSKSDWVVGDKWVRIGGTYYGAVSLRMLPTHVYPGLALQLAGLPFECTISMDCMALAKEKELELQWARARSDESKATEAFMGATPDPAEREKAEAQKQHYLEMTGAHQNPFRFRMVITVAAGNPDELTQHCDAVVSLLRNMKSTVGVREHYGVEGLLKTTWPFSLPSDLNARKALTSHIAALMPIYARWEGSRRAVTLFMDPLQRLVRHDPFPEHLANRNRTICGKSGSGKSFACQLADVQPHAARDNTEVLIIESGGSFRLTTECFGGLYIKLGPSSPYFINPFDLPPGFDQMAPADQEKELRYKFGFIKNLVVAMAKLHDPESQQLAENVVGTVAQRTYALSRTPRFRDFYRVLGEYANPTDPRAVELAGRLRTLLANYVVTEAGEAGIYSAYFDCFTNFESDKQVLTFDLIDVKNDPALLTPMCLVTLNGLVYNRLLSRDGKERVIIVDEAWALVKESANGEQSPAGQAIELFWREGRKLGGSSTMISQNYSDMANDKVGKAVVANSPIQYFLVHERLKANDDSFKAAGFTDGKIDRVYNLRTQYGAFSEIMVKEDTEWGVVRLPSIGLKYHCATTDPKDLNVQKEYFRTYQEGYGLPTHVVLAILAEDYPGGYHGAHGKPMTTQEALAFAERWQDHYRRFGDLVRQGKPIPPDFD